MKLKKLTKCLLAAGTVAALTVSLCPNVFALNPYMPLWEHVPDGEPHVFTDPNTGEERVYVYGSHDINKTKFCGNNYVVWSAPVDDLTDWTNHGVILECEVPEDAFGALFAPDLCQGPDGRFYLYSFPIGNTSLEENVFVSDSPTGPFTACGKVDASDPAVLCDDDGQVYLYNGGMAGISTVSRLDPEDMCTVLETKDMLNTEGEKVDNFYEGSSIRKVADDMYVYVYCSQRINDPEHVPSTMHGAQNGYCGLLEYAYSDNPMGPWTYGGIIMDNGGEALGTSQDYYDGTLRTYYDGNIHGGIEQINGQWYVFYHRHTNNNDYSRQACMEPIDLAVEGGKLVISQAEMTSQGCETQGLAGTEKYSAGIACYLTNGAYITTGYEEEPDYNPITNITNGTVAGVKYLNFESGNYTVNLDILPKGQAGKVAVILDSPDNSPLALVDIPGEASQEFTQLSANVGTIEGTHAVFFIFYGEGQQEICEFNSFQFTK